MKKIIMNYPFGSGAFTYLRTVLPIRHLYHDLLKEDVQLSCEVIKTLDFECYCYCFANCLQPEQIPQVEQIRQFTRICWATDDNYAAINPDNPAGKQITPLHVAGLQQMLSSSDFVWTTTKPLHELFKNKVLGKMSIIPNMVDMNDFPSYTDRSKNKNVFWAGSATHLNDLGLVADSINLMKDHNFIFLGQLPAKCCDYTMLNGNLIHAPLQSNVGYVPGVAQPYYQETFNKLASNAAVGICPLLNNVFNVSKSSLKFLEMAAMGLTVVASDVYPYSNAIIHGETGYLVKPGEWKDALEYAFAKPLGKKAYEWVRNEMSWQSPKMKKLWRDAYLELVYMGDPLITYGKVE